MYLYVPQYWLWKVVVAKEFSENELFMLWKWQFSNQIFSTWTNCPQGCHISFESPESGDSNHVWHSCGQLVQAEKIWFENRHFYNIKLDLFTVFSKTPLKPLLFNANLEACIDLFWQFIWIGTFIYVQMTNLCLKKLDLP